jgi:putative phosphoesterase
LAPGDERCPLIAERRFEAPLTLGVIADTHINPRGTRRLPAEVVALFRRFNVGLILHAGDVNTLAVLAELGSVAPVIAVAGNNDDAELRGLVPEVVHFEVGTFRFVMLHGHRGVSARSEARQRASQVDCVVYGHSHLPRIDQEGSVILFNPGSATDRRWGDHFGVGLIHVTRERIRPELVLYQDPRHLRNVAPE